MYSAELACSLGKGELIFDEAEKKTCQPKYLVTEDLPHFNQATPMLGQDRWYFNIFKHQATPGEDTR